MSAQWLDKILSRRQQWLLINGHKTVKVLTPVAKLIPVIRSLKGSADLAIWVAQVGAERETFGGVSMSSPEIAKYEASALGSTRLI